MDSTCKIIETLSLFYIGFNNKENKFLSLVYGCTNDTTVLDKFYTKGVSIFSFKKYNFANGVFILMLICRKQSLGLQEFWQFMEYLLAANSINIIVENFNDNLLKVSENKILNIFTKNVQRINKPTNISRSLTDYGWWKKTLMEEFSTNITVENFYFSDHDALRMEVIKKNLICFLGFLLILIYFSI